MVKVPLRVRAMPAPPPKPIHQRQVTVCDEPCDAFEGSYLAPGLFADKQHRLAKRAVFVFFRREFFGKNCEMAEFLSAYISRIHARPWLLAGLVKPPIMLNRLLRHAGAECVA